MCNTHERYIYIEHALKLPDKLIRVPENSFEEEAADIEISKREGEVLTLISEGYTNQA
ncbi:hypothetical protein NAF17_12185 [Mucilaginibacter sp. RB4R14]|uniref:hypothetical protein n=1 Tax=Mucilaginibacter aurantiaciroseus TaxID=2949308 RepID=UPI002090A695|nr:hypothetical protein [Mucilaginibacter aurantiaciroseus]MCO5936299.1 hypothetical protein [Mucilaginibacter aurantiaciroseus]